MLGILAGVAILLLIYQAWTLATSVLLPLLSNPNILQTDFHYYYEAAVRFRGDPSLLYLKTDDVIAGFAYPPPAIVPFVALSYVPLGVALVIFTIASYAAILAAMWMWVGHLRQRGFEVNRITAAAVTVIALALGPTYVNAIFGQVNAFVLECSVAFIVLAAARPIESGAMLAGGMWLKIYPALVVFVGTWDERARKAIGYAVIAAIAIAVAVLPIVPLDAYESFVDVLTTRFDKTAIHISNQSFIAFAERFWIAPERFLNWTGEQAITSGSAIRALNWTLGLGVIAWLWQRAKADAGAAPHSAAALMALATAIAPLGWGHTFLLVLPLVILHLIAARDASTLVKAMVAACVLALMIPAGRRFSFVEQWPAWMQNVAYSRYLLATSMLIAFPVRRDAAASKR